MLGIHDSSVLWIASSLNEQIKLGTYEETMEIYLDIDKVFEEFSLA